MAESIGARVTRYACALAWALSWLSAGGGALSAQVTEARYEGNVRTLAGQFVPFRLKVWKVGKDWTGSFILAKEAGPYDFKKVTYDPETRNLYFEYSPPSRVEMHATLSTPRFRHDRIQGELTSDRGKLGTIEATQSEGTDFSAEPFLVGQWAGNCATKEKTREVKLTLSSNAQADKGHPESDLPWIPGKEGYFEEDGGMRLPLASFVPDYSLPAGSF